MTITQTVDIPADRRLVIDVPREIPVGRTIIAFTPASDTAAVVVSSADDCPLCAKYRDPETGALRPNAETIAAIEESNKTSAKQFNSLEELLADLRS